MNGKTINIILITILICVSAASVWMENWHILITNICVIGGVFLDSKIQDMQTKEDANLKKIRLLQKVIHILYGVGALSLII
jgi:general stress protein CsbA